MSIDKLQGKHRCVVGRKREQQATCFFGINIAPPDFRENHSLGVSGEHHLLSTAVINRDYRRASVAQGMFGDSERFRFYG